MARFPLSILGDGVVVVLAMLAVSPASACGGLPSGQTWQEVSEIASPDRFLLADGTAVRLGGVSAPGQDWNGSAVAAASATAALGELISGKPVAVVPLGDPDRHGRTPAAVYLPDGTLVQEQLVRAGDARVRIGQGEEACRERLLAAEQPARQARLGLWSSPDYAIRNAEDSSLRERNGLYELVQGRVLSVGAGTRMIFLDFGRNYRQDFTVMVSPPVAKALADNGFDVESLQGRRVLVRGVIEESGGPAIRLGHPADILLLD